MSRQINVKRVGVVGAGVVVVFGMFWGLANLATGDGDRAGYVQRISHKRHFRTLFLVPSWEGDLALLGSARSTGAIGNAWAFTVDDPEVVQALQAADPTKPVKLHYKEYMWTWIGDTTYRVTRVEHVGN